MKPIGYYVSVPEGHESYQGLVGFRMNYGDWMENTANRELWSLLRLFADVAEKRTEQTFSFGTLTHDVCFDLIPFLHQVIKERMDNGN